MSHHSRRGNDLATQILLFLLAIGLYLVADDDENHWSARVACAAILIAFPLIYSYGVAGSALSSAIGANDLTDGAWGLALLFSLVGLAVVCWFGFIVYRCVEAMTDANGWVVIPVGLFTSGVAVYWLWSFEIGWWNFLAIPAIYFAVCVLVEGVFTGKLTEESDEQEQTSVDDTRQDINSRKAWLWVSGALGFGAVIFIFSMGEDKQSSISIAQPGTGPDLVQRDNRRLSLEFARLHWPVLRDELRLPPDTRFDEDEYELLAIGIADETIGSFHRYQGDYFVYVEAIPPEQTHVRDETHCWRPSLSRQEIYEVMRARQFELRAIASESFRGEFAAYGFVTQ